jgi:hypothetical protein
MFLIVSGINELWFPFKKKMWFYFVTLIHLLIGSSILLLTGEPKYDRNIDKEKHAHICSVIVFRSSIAPHISAVSRDLVHIL